MTVEFKKFLGTVIAMLALLLRVGMFIPTLGHSEKLWEELIDELWMNDWLPDCLYFD